MTGREGFTLFELLVVLAILGCVAAAVPWAQHSLVDRVRLTFATRAATRRIYNAEASSLASGLPAVLTAEDFSAGFGQRVRLQTLGAAEAPASLWLFPDGSASPTIVELELGRLHQRLSVNGLTGVVNDAD